MTKEEFLEKDCDCSCGECGIHPANCSWYEVRKIMNSKNHENLWNKKVNQGIYI